MFDRYRRQTAFAPLGEEGQRRLRKSRVLVVGCGALGGTVADLLVRAGVGTDDGLIALIDPDIVQEDNLHRQILFTERDALESRFKVDAARAALLAADRGARLETIVGRFDESNESMLEGFDLLIDATDNFPARFLMNRAAVRFRKPFVTAGVLGASGQMLAVLPGETACLECLLDPNANHENDSGMDRYGILSPLPQVFASLEVLEAIKVLSGHRDAVNRSLLVADLWENQIRSIRISRNEKCPVCGTATTGRSS